MYRNPTPTGSAEPSKQLQIRDTSMLKRVSRPYDHITRAEALGILMKAVKDEGGWAGYSYYWSSSLPNPDSTTGYKDIYSFGAEWQAWVFYDYIKKVLEDDKRLYINPRANDRATRREVFDFAATIDKKINNNSSLVNTSNIDLDISFNAPSDAVVSTAKSRKTIDGISINELIVTPLGVDATSVYFFTSYASFDEVKNIHIYSSNIKSSSFYDTTVAGYKGVRRVDKYLNNDCIDETTVVEKAGVIYGYTMALCPTHPAGYDQIRKDIANSLSFL